MSDAKIVLVIDTAMEGCGVGVFGATRNISHALYNDDARGQAQQLVPLVQRVLDESNTSFDDLNDIVVCNGPGTFTGIRIGLSAAKTFGLTLGVEVHGISSLQALALSVDMRGTNSDIMALVETRRQDFYVQRFDCQGLAINEYKSMMAEEIDARDCVLIGNAMNRFDNSGKYERKNITRINVLDVAKAFIQGKNFFYEHAEPIYLRAPDVSQPKVPPRQIYKR